MNANASGQAVRIGTRKRVRIVHNTAPCPAQVAPRTAYPQTGSSARAAMLTLSQFAMRAPSVVPSSMARFRGDLVLGPWTGVRK